MFSRTLLCVTLSAIALPSFADNVWLKNGDRLTGKISVLDGGKLLIETEYGGSIPLKWSKIATLESDQKLLIKQNDVTGEVAQSLRRPRCFAGASSSATATAVARAASTTFPLSFSVVLPSPVKRPVRISSEAIDAPTMRGRK